MITPKRKTSISKLVLPLITLGILAILCRYNLKWGTLPIIVILLFYYFVMPKISKAVTDRFSRRAIMLLTGGKVSELIDLIKRGFFYQLFVPKEVLDSKAALAYLECELFSEALQCLERAIPYSDSRELTTLQIGLVKALFATGDFKRAELEGKNLIRNVVKLPELLAFTAGAGIALGKSDDETMRMLDEAEKLSPCDDVKLMIMLSRIEAALLQGRKLPDLENSADSSRKFLRAWIHLVRGKLREHRGDSEKAVQSFEKAIAALPNCFVAAEAKRHLKTLNDIASASLQSQRQDNSITKDSTKKKKRKRR